MTYQAPPIPSAFIWRRAHSFTGLWLVLFLIQHLFTNSLSVLMIGEYGRGFISSVNSIKNLPYLPFIELMLLGVPFLIHGIWGVKYLMTGKSNSFPTTGATPSLPQYSRNHAYSWQRITSWILLVGIIAHVIHMRFLEYPSSAIKADKEYYFVPVQKDRGFEALSYRWDFQLWDAQRIQKAKEDQHSFVSGSSDNIVTQLQDEEQKHWMEILEKQSIKQGQEVAIVDSFGLASFLMVKETFKSPTMVLLYTGLVLAACFHAFNGLWTFMISWGVTLTERSQRGMRTLATLLMLVVTFWGLVAIWGNYWYT